MRYYEQKYKKQVHRMLKMPLFHSHLHCITYFYYYFFFWTNTFITIILIHKQYYLHITLSTQNVQANVFPNTHASFCYLSHFFTLSYLLFHTIMLSFTLYIPLHHYTYIYTHAHTPQTTGDCY